MSTTNLIILSHLPASNSFKQFSIKIKGQHYCHWQLVVYRFFLHYLQVENRVYKDCKYKTTSHGWNETLNVEKLVEFVELRILPATEVRAKFIVQLSCLQFNHWWININMIALYCTAYLWSPDDIRWSPCSHL